MATYTVGPFECTGLAPDGAGGQIHAYSGQLVITETVNNSANTSSISWSFQIFLNRSNYVSNYTYQNNNAVSVSINGSVVYSSANAKAVALNGRYIGNPFELASGSGITVTHDNDGTKTIAVSATYRQSNSAYLNTINVSGNVQLTSIPRASAVDSVTNVMIGSAPTVKWTPAVSSYYYTITFSCGSKSATPTTNRIAGGSTQKSYSSFTIPTDWADQITESKSATATVKITTYTASSGGTNLGTMSKTFKITVPDSDTFKPTGAMTVTAVEEKLNLNLTGITSFTYDCSGSSGKYGATINGYAVTVKNSSGSVVHTGSSSTGTVGAVSKATTLTFSLIVTDSRGYTSSTPVNIQKTITAYSKPSVKMVTATRGTGSVSSSTSSGITTTTCSNWSDADASGSVVMINYTTSYTALSGNTLVCQIIESKGSTTTRVNGGSNKNHWVTGYTNTETAYTFTVKVYDSVTTSSNVVQMTANLPAAWYPVDFLDDGTGGAIGKVATRSGAMEFAWDIAFDTAHSLKFYDSGGRVLQNYDAYTTIPSEGADLNTYTEAGRYTATSTAIARLCTNGPYNPVSSAVAFQMIVECVYNQANYKLFCYTLKDYNGEIFTRRNYYSSSTNHFTDWCRVAFDNIRQIASGTDMNSIVGEGTYIADSHDIAASLANCPTDRMFHLRIDTINNSSTGYKRFYTLEDYDANIWTRRNTYYSSADHFNNWKRIAYGDSGTITGSALDSNGMVNLKTALGVNVEYVMSVSLIKGATTGGYGLYFWTNDGTTTAHKIVIKRTDGGTIASGDEIRIIYAPA